MKILIYSETTANTVPKNLGRAEYSYYFILEKYLPLLESIGELVFVSDPAREVDRLYDEIRQSGSEAVFLSFTPPHRTARISRCPTVCVMAWEFDRIPDDNWDPEEPWNNWVTAIREIGNVITISDYATQVIKRQVGHRPRVVTIPAPVTHESGSVRGHRSGVEERKTLRLTAGIIDSAALNIDTESVTPRMSDAELLGEGQASWDGHAVDWYFSSKSDTAGQYLVGFYAPEDWGCWSKIAHPSIILPWSISGDLELTLELLGYGENRGKTVGVVIGDEVVELELPPQLQIHKLQFSLQKPANSIHFSGIEAIPAPGARDHRTLGIGLASLTLRRLDDDPETIDADSAEHDDNIAAETESVLDFSGTVYTSVFNPDDGRKNWHDMVTAFCWAFRDDPEKTLVLKMSHHNRGTFLGKLLLLFSRLSPFQCRIIAVHGYLSTEELHDLVKVTDFFVNTSLAEGQCLPLLEFMAEGVPAIAPDHTAMATYINKCNAFVVESSPQPHVWPTDPRNSYRTISNRIDWHSLYQAYLDSAATWQSDSPAYHAMAEEAARAVRQHYSAEKVARDLEEFLKSTARRRRG